MSKQEVQVPPHPWQQTHPQSSTAFSNYKPTQIIYQILAKSLMHWWDNCLTNGGQPSGHYSNADLHICGPQVPDIIVVIRFLFSFFLGGGYKESWPTQYGFDFKQSWTIQMGEIILLIAWLRTEFNPPVIRFIPWTTKQNQHHSYLLIILRISNVFWMLLYWRGSEKLSYGITYIYFLSQVVSSTWVWLLATQQVTETWPRSKILTKWGDRQHRARLDSSVGRALVF